LRTQKKEILKTKGKKEKLEKNSFLFPFIKFIPIFLSASFPPKDWRNIRRGEMRHLELKPKVSAS